jgi:hypothetical protein
VAHDILNRRIHSFYADEIRARFAAPEFFFLGSAHVLPDYPELLLSRQAFAAWQQLVAGADASFREAARDFMLNTGLRFDLFRRSGQESRIRGERLQQLGELWLQRTEARDDIDSRRRWSAGCAVDLGGPLHSTILDLAAAPAITLGEILRSGELKGFAITDVELAIEHLFAIGLVNVLVRRPLETRYSGDRRYRLSSPLNALRLEESRSSSAAEGLASTVLGSPLLMPPAARLQLLAMLGNVPQPASDLAPQMLRLGIIEEER